MSEEEMQEAPSEEVAAEPVAEAPEAPAEASEPVVGEQPEQTEGQPQEVWGHFRNLPQFQGQEDQAIAQRLYQALEREESASRALQQYQSIVPVAQEYIQNRTDYEAWKEGRNNPAPPPQEQPQEKPWWNPPTLKESHKRYLNRDEAGREVIDPNAPMDARSALEDYQQYRADFAQKFLDNPQDALGPMVEKVAMERAEQLIDTRMQRMNDENYVSRLEQENRDWLYDERGNVSAEGVAVQKYIQDAKSFGIQGAEQRWDYATKMVERDLMLAKLRNNAQPQQQVQAPQTGQTPESRLPTETQEQKNMEFLRRTAMRTASQRPADGGANARAPKKPMTFEERLTAEAQKEGLI
jgi:hypothetical protein